MSLILIAFLIINEIVHLDCALRIDDITLLIPWEAATRPARALCGCIKARRSVPYSPQNEPTSRMPGKGALSCRQADRGTAGRAVAQEVTGLHEAALQRDFL